MLIVDAQVHIWGADTPDRPWPPGRAHMALFTEELPWLSAENKEWIRGRAIGEWLGRPLPKKS